MHPTQAGDHATASGPRRSRLGGLLRSGARALGDLVLPPACLACHTPLAEHDSLCAGCWRSIIFVRPPLCDRLGLPMPFGGTGRLVSAAAAAEPPVWDRLRAVAVYEGVMRDMIHALKYADRHDARRLFGRWLAEAGRDLLGEADVIVPVPLTRWRLLRRQFNQAALLAREVSVRTGVPADPHALAKIRTTLPQMGLSGEQRRLNVRGAFRVPDRYRRSIAGRRVVLLDDVTTTGATLTAATRALQAAGAAHVDALVLALVPDRHAVTV